MHGHAAPSLAPRIIVVTASDSRFMPFLRGMLASIAGRLALPNVALGCFDIGLEPQDRAWLEAGGAQVVAPRAHLGVDAQGLRPALLSFLARPFLPEYFPGHDVYLWIDSDVWLQDAVTFDTYVDAAMAHGMAIAHERTRAYRFQPWLFGWTAKHFLLGYGPVQSAYLLTRRHLNAGFFAIKAGAPHWVAWAARYRAAIGRAGGALVPHDQFALNQALHGALPGLNRLAACLLPPRFNWICDRGIPMWNDEAAAFCEPVAPFTPIGALHLAGPAKRTAYHIRRTGGGAFSTCLLYGASPEQPLASPLAIEP
jgi:hypothetical protein